MANLGRFGDVLGIFILPFVAIAMLIMSPVILILIFWRNK